MAVKSSPTRPAARQPRPSQAPKAGRPRPPRNNDRYAHDIWGLALVTLGLILFVSLVLPHRGQAGLLGDALVQGLRLVVGIGDWVFPFFLTAIGIMLIQGREQHTRTNFAGGAGLAFVIGIAWWHLGHTTRLTEFKDITEGGWVGAAISSGLRALIGDISSNIFLFVFSVGAVVWATDMRLLHLFGHAIAGGKRVTGPVAQGARVGAAALKERTKKEPTPKQVSTLPKREGREVGAPLAAPTSLAAPSRLAVPFSEAASEPLRPPVSGGPLRSKEVGSFPPSGPALDDDMPTVPKVNLPTLPPSSWKSLKHGRARWSFPNRLAMTEPNTNTFCLP